MNIAWGDLGLVLIVGLAAGAGIVAIFSFGITALAGRAVAPGRAPQPRQAPDDATSDGEAVVPASSGARFAGYACFVLCGLLVIWGIYLAIPSLHKVF
jgi:hypothetical protein